MNVIPDRFPKDSDNDKLQNILRNVLFSMERDTFVGDKCTKSYCYFKHSVPQYSGCRKTSHHAMDKDPSITTIVCRWRFVTKLQSVGSTVITWHKSRIRGTLYIHCMLTIVIVNSSRYPLHQSFFSLSSVFWQNMTTGFSWIHFS